MRETLRVRKRTVMLFAADFALLAVLIWSVTIGPAWHWAVAAGALAGLTGVLVIERRTARSQPQGRSQAR